MKRCSTKDTIEDILLNCTGQSEEKHHLQKLVKEQRRGQLSLAITTINPVIWDLAHKVYKRH